MKYNIIKHNNENVPEDLRSTMLSTEGKLNAAGQNTDYIVGDGLQLALHPNFAGYHLDLSVTV